MLGNHYFAVKALRYFHKPKIDNQNNTAFHFPYLNYFYIIYKLILLDGIIYKFYKTNDLIII